MSETFLTKRWASTTNDRYQWSEDRQTGVWLCVDTEMDGYSGIVFFNPSAGRWEVHTTGPKEVFWSTEATRAEAQREVEKKLAELRLEAVKAILDGSAQPRDGKPFEL